MDAIMTKMVSDTEPQITFKKTNRKPALAGFLLTAKSKAYLLG
jgi:hypothetical protein